MFPSQEYKEQWTLLEKLFFRFILLFLVGFMFLMVGNYFIEPILIWLGKYVFHLKEHLEIVSTGSGDGIMSWLSLSLQLFLAILGTAAWSILDRKKASYNKLFYWFRIVMRLFLILFLLLYGLAKVFLIQFQEPSLIALLQPLGEMSPMGLAWTYMGFSPTFTIFTGLLEVTAGLLLIPRRTQTLGALMTAGVMTHVAVMNLCFDIPVKIFSIHLLLIALTLLISDRKRFLFAFYRTSKETVGPYYQPIDLDYVPAIKILKKIGVGMFIVISIILGVIVRKELGVNNSIKDEFYGIWEVDTFIKNGDTIPSLTTANERWRYMIMESKDRTTIKKMNDSLVAYHFKIDSTKTQISIYQRNKNEVLNNFRFIKRDSLQIHIRGVIDSDSLELHLKPKNLKDFRLINRGFHWVNERPFNY